MRMGLQVGFGAPVGGALLDQVKQVGFDMARVCANLPSPSFAGVDLAPIVEEVRAAGLSPLVIIRDAAQIEQIPAGVDIEMGNEPNLAKNGWREGNNGNPDLPSYKEAALKAIAAADGRNPLWVGCPTNLNEDGFAFLRSLPWADLPAWVGCSIHRYPDGNRGPEATTMTSKHLLGLVREPWTRDQEIQALREVVGDRPLGLSEIGYNDLDYPDEEIIASNFAWERAFFAGHGFNFAVAYEINSGKHSSTSRHDHYGFRDKNGQWRRQTYSWCGSAAH